MRLSIIILFLLTLPGCADDRSPKPSEGIKGTVLWLEGNMMPGPGREPAGQPVVRDIYVYQLLKESDLKKTELFYALPDQQPLKVVTSDAKGQFSVDLPPGKYSLLSKEEPGLYANLFDGEGHIHPVEVKSGQFTEVTFKIDYQAYY